MSAPSASLLRVLGPATAIAMVVGNVIGAGIFLKPGNIAGDCGSFPMILLVWIGGGVLCMLGALCMAELATMLPQAGGLYVYLYRAYGPLTAFLFGWTEMFFVRPASIAALAIAFIGSLALTLEWDISGIGRALLASLLITGLAVVNMAGVIWGGRLLLATTWVKVVFLLLVILAPLWAAPWSGWLWSPSNYLTTVTPKQPHLTGQIAAVLLSVMWAYNGWHALTPLAEELREPQRTIPLALFWGIGILMVLYVAANLTYYGVMSMSELAQAGDHGAERMLSKLAGPTGRRAMSLVIMCSTFGALNSDLLQAPRITYAMGRDRLFFTQFGRVHATLHTPVSAIVVTAAMAIALVLTVTIAKWWVVGLDMQGMTPGLGRRIVESLLNDSIFDLLTNFVVFSASLFYVLAVAALIVLRLRFPEWERPYRAWGYPWVAILFVVVYVWFLGQVYASSPLESRMGLIFIALGVPVHFAFARFGRPSEPAQV